MTEALAPTAAAVVAVLGNPNTGKSSLFNALTGARQTVSNYPGITVERVAGTLRVGERAYTLIDLPGTYSLAAISPDERVVLEVLLGQVEGTSRPQAVVCVVEAANLKRNLFLASQVAETGLPLVVALNMSDEARERGLEIDAAALASKLRVPVVATVATTGEGLDELKRAIAAAADSTQTLVAVPWPAPVNEAVAMLRAAVETDTGRHMTDIEARRMLFDAALAPPSRLDWPEDRAREAVDAARARLRDAGLDPLSVEAHLRFAHLASLTDGVVRRGLPRRSAGGYALDRILTHRVLGLVIFAALMFTMFSSIYWLAAPAMDGIEVAFTWLGEAAGSRLESVPTVRSLVKDGIFAGVGGVVVFLPQILILFLFIAILEDSGYMARAAFLMDRVFAWTGLNGKSFVPMLSSFACAVPAIMGTRTIEDPRARISTILVSPLMSCSARLPVYVLLIGAFIEPVYGPIWAGVALFAMHALGLFLAIPIAFIINRFLLRVRSVPFVLEMPPYRRPGVRNVALKLWRSGSEFVVRAGTVIFAFAILIWALTYFPRPDAVRDQVASAAATDRGIAVDEARALLDGDLKGELAGAYLEQSWLGRFGKAVQPAFAPLGYDWRITVGVLASFPAREIIVSTLGIVYRVGEQDEEKADALLRERMAATRRANGRPVYTPAVAVSIMVFFALCLQCFSTIAVIGREAGWRWAGVAFAYMTALAWTGSFIAYQLGSAILESGA